MSIKKISFLGVYVGLIILFTFVPYTGYININFMAFTIMPFFVVLATYHLGFAGAIISSASFGVGSFLRALYFGNFIMSNPMTSILSRVILGVVVYLTYICIPKKNFTNNLMVTIIAFIMNAVLVSSFFLFSDLSFEKAGLYKTSIFWFGKILLNFCIEISLGTFLYCITHRFFFAPNSIFSINSKNNW